MRILTYKQTHIGDPSLRAAWGETGCMGQVRNGRYDAVIGVGGIGPEPREEGIARKLTWIGVGGQAVQTDVAGNSIVLFPKFNRWGTKGPLLADLAPNLAARMYDGAVRHLSVGYTATEQREAEAVIEWFLSGGRKTINGTRVAMPRGEKDKGARADCPPPRQRVCPPIACPPSCSPQKHC